MCRPAEKPILPVCWPVDCRNLSCLHVVHGRLIFKGYLKCFERTRTRESTPWGLGSTLQERVRKPKATRERGPRPLKDDRRDLAIGTCCLLFNFSPVERMSHDFQARRVPNLSMNSRRDRTLNTVISRSFTCFTEHPVIQNG